MSRIREYKGFSSKLNGLKQLLTIAAIAGFLLTCTACDNESDHPAGSFIVKVKWESPADMDAHVWATPTDHCWVDACTNTDLTGPVDDETGSKGEEIMGDLEAAPGLYRVGINLHDFPAGSTPGDRSVTVELIYWDGHNIRSQSYGPYVLNTPIGHGGYPVTGNTASWWRPFDVLVLADGTSQPKIADGTPCQGP